VQREEGEEELKVNVRAIHKREERRDKRGQNDKKYRRKTKGSVGWGR